MTFRTTTIIRCDGSHQNEHDHGPAPELHIDVTAQPVRNVDEVLAEAARIGWTRRWRSEIDGGPVGWDHLLDLCPRCSAASP